MNSSIRQRSENQVKPVTGISSEPKTMGSIFNFRQSLSHRRLDPGRYLILMRQYHGKSTWRRSAGFVTPGGS